MNRPATPWLVAVAYTDLPSDARVLREAREAARRGARVTIVAPTSPSSSHAAPIEDVEVIWLPATQERGRTTLRGQLRFIRQVQTWVRTCSERPDVVHLHNMPDYLYWAVGAWQAAGTRVVLDVHDIMSDLAIHRFMGVRRLGAQALLRRAEALVWHRVDHVVTVHEPYRRRLVSRGVPATKVSVVLNVPDPALCHPGLRRRPIAGRFKVVFHGTISARTGVTNLVRAVPLLQNQIPELEVRIIGAGDGVAAVHAEIRRLGVSKQVTLVGHYLPFRDVLHEIADADAGVAPNERSAYTSTILPVKLLEYVTLGIPAIATRLPVVEEYVGDEAAVLVDEPEPAAIAEALVRLCRNFRLRESLVEGCGRVRARHRWQRYADELAQALRLDDGVALSSNGQNHNLP